VIRLGLIDPGDSRELRRRVLRPHLRPGDPLPGDELVGGVHVGALEADGTVVATCYIYPDACYWRANGAEAWHLRQMATAPERQGQGLGGAVLAAAIEYLEQHAVPLVWCHAREQAVPFYAGHGFHGYGDLFDEFPLPGPPVPHLRMWRELATPATSSG
jgi:GNAT superfamily N-acetyltransferase